MTQGEHNDGSLGVLMAGLFIGVFLGAGIALLAINQTANKVCIANGFQAGHYQRGLGNVCQTWVPQKVEKR